MFGISLQLLLVNAEVRNWNAFKCRRFLTTSNDISVIFETEGVINQTRLLYPELDTRNLCIGICERNSEINDDKRNNTLKVVVKSRNMVQ